jgi:Cu2+-exporting ATPase
MTSERKTAGTNEKARRRTIPVTGMSCAACAITVEQIVAGQPGVVDASVNYANQSLQVAFDPGIVSPAAMQQAVQAMGYDLILTDDLAESEAAVKEAREAEWISLRKRTIGAAVLAIPVFILGMFFMDLPYANWMMLALSTPVVGWFGRQFFVQAWKQAAHGKANMDTLVAISTGIAYLFSAFNTFFPDYFHRHGLHGHVYFEAAAVVITFILLGKLLESKAKSNTSEAIQKLMGLQPKTVVLIRDGKEILVEIANVRPGDQIRVKPGEKIAVDGSVVSGSSYVDESMISGEPVPVFKETGGKVLAGTINQQGSFEFVAEKVGQETLLAQIIRLVQEAQGSKAPVQHLVDKIAGIFVPVVLGIAVLTFTVWMLAGGENAFAHALVTAISVLVIACPCALGLATPTAIMVGIGRGAGQGILIRDAEGLETARRVDTVVLDKTGTITEGKPMVTAIEWLQNDQKQLLAGILLSLEKKSEHPLAAAVTAHLEKESITELPVESFENKAGKGVVARRQGETYWAGGPAMAAEMNLAGAAPAIATTGTTVYFGSTHAIFATITITDPIKTTSADAIQALQKMGIAVHLFTGDQAGPAAAVAASVGISAVQAGMLPNDKSEGVRALQQSGKVVAMVGDGINDAQALAQADLSIAMGRGSDIAMDVAQITLMHADLLMIPRAIQLSRQTVATIRQNLFWAFFYNLIGIPLAAGVLFPFNGFLLNPMIAGGAMALSSVSVVSNSIRLKFKKLI